MEGKGGGEHQLRRLHIVYFLSSLGCFEQPHLIRVYHLARSGVYLRDVKRWLADLRGEDMPEAFSWSYKRRYKTGYVWQDLLDDDLITPISDNEYVLKGSLVSFDPLSNSLTERKTTPKSNDLDHIEEEHKPSLLKEGSLQKQPDSKIQTPSEIHEESPEPLDSARSTITDEYDLMKNKKFENRSSFYANLLNMKSKKNNNVVKDRSKEMSGTEPSSSFSSSTSSSSSQSSFAKSKSYSTGASSVFRNLITCGAMDTNDSVLVIPNRPQKNAPNKADYHKSAQIYKGDKLGGSERIFRSIWGHHQIENPPQQQNYTARKSVDGGNISSRKNKQNEDSNLKTISGAYKPVRWPKCSQCGKSFKPEKLHAHMKTCRGIKALPKTSISDLDKTVPHRSLNCSNNQLFSC